MSAALSKLTVLSSIMLRLLPSVVVVVLVAVVAVVAVGVVVFCSSNAAQTMIWQ